MGLTYMGLTPCHYHDYKRGVTSRKTVNSGMETGGRENSDLLLSVEEHLTIHPCCTIIQLLERTKLIQITGV